MEAEREELATLHHSVYCKKGVNTMTNLEQKLQQLIRFINYFRERASKNYIAIQYDKDKDKDIGNIGEYFLNVVSGNIDKFLDITRFDDCKPEYIIKVDLEKSDEDDIVIDSSKLFVHREAVITFKVKNVERIEYLIAYDLRDWAYQFAKWREDKPAQLTMCVPPDKGESNYREHMNEFIKNKLNGDI